MSGIVDLNDYRAIIEENNQRVRERKLMEERKITGYTFHAGDLFHVGHLMQLRASAVKCDYLIVGVLTDQAIASYKRMPIIPYQWRAVIYRDLKMVDRVVVQDSRDPTANLKWLRPDVLFHGDDWGEVPGEQWMIDNGGKVIKTPYFHPLSTSDIIQRCYEARARGVSDGSGFAQCTNADRGCGGPGGPCCSDECSCQPETEKGQCSCSDNRGHG